SIHNHYLHSFPTRRSSDLLIPVKSFSKLQDALKVIESATRGAIPLQFLNGLAHQVLCNDPLFAVRFILRSRRLEIEADSQFVGRSEEHTSELQSRGHLVCR